MKLARRRIKKPASPAQSAQRRWAWQIATIIGAAGSIKHFTDERDSEVVALVTEIRRKLFELEKLVREKGPRA